MRVEQMHELVATMATERFLERRGYATALGTGLQLPDVARRAAARARSTERQLDASAMHQLDDSVAEKRAIAVPTPSFMGPRNAMADWMGRIGRGASNILGQGISGAGKAGLTAGGLMAGGALGAFGKELGSMAAGLMRDMAAKAQATVGGIGAGMSQAAIFSELKHEDPVLAAADDKTLGEAYHTMQRFAPTASTDKNLVRSFLRQAVMGGGGLDFATVKLLADTERAVNNTGKVE